MKAEPESVSQSTTLIWSDTRMIAERAVDGDMNTNSHTVCAWGTEFWFKMEFNAVFCFSEVIIIQCKTDRFAQRMQDTQVFVINTDEGTESLCGVLKIRDVLTTKGQTYRINCDLKCGNEVELKLRHDRGKYKEQGCIHMTEIIALRIAYKG
jgi:hypothetical protein